MTVFHLLRHGTYSGLGDGVLVGRGADPSLDQEGEAAAARIADALGVRPIATVIASPRARARETARPLAGALRLPITVASEWDEIDFGGWTGRRWGELGNDPAWRDWNERRGTARCPGGETVSAVAGRALALLHRLGADLGPDREAALFGHADVIRIVICACLGLAPDLMLRFAVDPAGRSTIRLRPGEAPVVLGINLPP